MGAGEEDDARCRFTLEADAENIGITLAEDFFNDLDDVAFDARVQRVADAVRTALYTVAGFSSTRH